MSEVLGFSKIEYLITFQSIIFGFVASQFLDGWGQMLRLRERIKPDLVFTLFTLVLFSVLLIHWWNLFGRALKMTKSMLEFLSVIPYTAIFYFIAVLLFDKIRRKISEENKVDLRSLFFEQKTKVFLTLLVFFIYDLPLTIHRDSLIFRVAGIGICLAGIFAKPRNVHLFIQLISIALLSLYIFQDYQGLIPERPIGQTYSKAEHLTIFISVIYAYIIAVFLRGWAGLFRLKKDAFSVTQFLWSLFSFVFLIAIWWGSWERTGLITQSILHFVIFLIVPFIIYLICVLLFPHAETESYNKHFFANKQLIFALFALLLTLQIAFSYFFQEASRDQNYMRLAGVILALISSKVNNLTFHKVIIATAFVLLITNMILTN
ncbi:MAG: hypothetical protein ABJG41_07555 [Cyclobacteriaceae bacterium]